MLSSSAKERSQLLVLVVVVICTVGQSIETTVYLTVLVYKNQTVRFCAAVFKKCSPGIGISASIPLWSWADAGSLQGV